jgi:hypothetical protein
MSNEVDLRKQRKVEADITIGDEVNIKFQLADNSTVTNLPSSLVAITLKAQNSLRRELTIHNNTNGKVFVLKGSGATSTNYSYELAIKDHLHIDDYRGIVTAICTDTTGSILVTETYY